MNHRPLENLIDFKNFEIYSKALVNSKDVDPVYPFLKQIIHKEGFNPEEAVFWYGYFYSISSMVKLLRGEIVFEQARYGIERGRTPQIRIGTNKEKTLSAWKTIRPMEFAREAKNSREFANYLRQVPYFGGWVTYKYTELFEKTLGFSNLAPTDMNISEGDVNGDGGPCGGLRHLYGISETYSSAIVPEWESLGKTLSERWGYDLGAIETCACKWRKMRVGKYYIGHDICEFTDDSVRSLWRENDFIDLMKSAGFQEEIWEHGFVKENQKMYKEQGVIINSHFAEKE